MAGRAATFRRDLRLWVPPVAVNDSPTAFLIACGATGYDESATMEARQNRPDDSLLVQAMLWHGAKVNVTDKFGQMPLLCAVQSSRLETVRLLLEHAADVSVPDSNGLTAVHYASIDANEPILHQLLDHGGNVNTQDNKGMTALYYAVWGHDVSSVVHELLKHKADPNLARKDGSTPLMVAQGYPDIIALLRQAGASK